MFVLYPLPFIILLRLFRTWPVRMGFMVDEITQRQVFLRVLQFSHVSMRFMLDKTTQRQVFLRVFRFPMSIWDLCWTKWHRDRFSSEYIGFPLQMGLRGGGVVMDKMTLEQISLQVLRFSPVSIIPRELHTLSFIFQRCSEMVTDDIVVK
jgi:hypothetical protein